MPIEKRTIAGVERNWDTDLGGPVTYSEVLEPVPAAPLEPTPAPKEEVPHIEEVPQNAAHLSPPLEALGFAPVSGAGAEGEPPHVP